MRSRLNLTSSRKFRSAKVPRRFSTLVLLLSIRVLRSWNQTGQKHSGEPDIARNILPAHTSFLWLFVLMTYLNVALQLRVCKPPILPQKFHSAFSFILCMAALRFKASFTSADAPELLINLPRLFLLLIDGSSLVNQARAVFLGLGAMFLVAAIDQWCQKFLVEAHSEGKKKAGLVKLRVLTSLEGKLPLLRNLLTLFLMTQTRLTNIPLFLLFELMLQLLKDLHLSGDEFTLASVLFQFTSFFAFGGSNSISSIDLSNAYNGIDGYRIAAVGLLTFVGNWAGPLWWTTATSSLMLEHNRQGPNTFIDRHLWLITALDAGSALAVMLACTMLRAHLFIWTVFSPKYLYSIVWSVVQHFCVNIMLGGLILWSGHQRP